VEKVGDGFKITRMRLEVRGKFMGSGSTYAVANFRPEKSGPDFDVDAADHDTDGMKLKLELCRDAGLRPR
jgi:hypothetical protein